MSREIKFRAWHETDKCWYNPRFIEMNLLGQAIIYHGLEQFEIIPASNIEQYTGLKDKNGKEVYSGDIFRNTINGGTWRVYWNEKDAAFWVDSGVAGCSLGEFDWDRSERKYGFIRKNCEVIGNINDNPELLKGEK